MINYGEPDHCQAVMEEEYKVFQESIGYTQKKHKVLDPRVAFDIGWDYYVYSIGIPSFLRNLKDFNDGHDAAKDKSVKQVASNPYVRKWLLLRYNAWLRNRLVDDSVTPQFLKFIDTSHCPVTGVELTKQTGTGSDWSVDRVNNNAGYAAGNIIIVSVRANTLKSNLSFDDLIELAYNDKNTVEVCKDERFAPLTQLDWMRWAFIVSLGPFEGKENKEDYRQSDKGLPAVIRPPSGMFCNTYASIQVAIADRIYGDFALYNKLIEAIPKANRKDFHAVVKKGMASNCGYPSFERTTEIWFDLAVYRAFTKAMDKLPNSSIVNIKNVMNKNTCSLKVKDDINMGMSQNGYKLPHNVQISPQLQG